MSNHNETNHAAGDSGCQPNGVRAMVSAPLNLRRLPPRMVPGQPILSLRDLLKVGGSLIVCSQRDDAGVPHTIWYRYDTWRAFICHVRRFGFPRLYWRGY